MKANNGLENRRQIQKVAVLSSQLPRMCGIATFASDLAHSLRTANPKLKVDPIAVSDQMDYSYPATVRHYFDAHDQEAYRKAASMINSTKYDVLSIQHEYGIYGGDAGSHLLDLVRDVRLPVVTTLHTVRQSPSYEQRQVLGELIRLSERIVVMSQKAIEFLVEIHGVSPNKIDHIPHGIPAIDPTSSEKLREKLRIQGPFILTFGLLSKDKGIQFAIEAMSRILGRYPNAKYVVVGATHPNLKSKEGESYRESLMDFAKELEVDRNVQFIDRFVPTSELVQYLGAMDFYITPYLNSEQITSGTLAYSIGAGKVVISTPYWYAQELLSEGRGILVPFRDSEAIANAVISSLESPELQTEMGLRASEYGQTMLWPVVGERYLESFGRAHRARIERSRRLIDSPTVPVRAVTSIPSFNFHHLKELSDDTGIFQHAIFSCPNRSEGYCVDDNARALLFTVLMDQSGEAPEELMTLQNRYLSFVHHSFNPMNGRFRNFMSFGREWLEDGGSDDSQGRALWALGATSNRSRDLAHREIAAKLFVDGMLSVVESIHLRTLAYSIMGAAEYLAGRPHEYPALVLIESLAGKLYQSFEENSRPDWLWFEPTLTYANARLSQALIIAGEQIGNRQMVEAGLASLAWLMSVQTSPASEAKSEGAEVFAPIGSSRAYSLTSERSYFDQQPIEASASISACLVALRVTQDRVWLARAQSAFDWFLGKNMLGKSLYVPATGGCHDGLHPLRVNQNQGAESTLSFLLALVEMRQQELPTRHQRSRTRMA